MFNLSAARNKLMKDLTYLYDPIPESSHIINNTFLLEWMYTYMFVLNVNLPIPASQLTYDTRYI